MKKEKEKKTGCYYNQLSLDVMLCAYSEFAGLVSGGGAWGKMCPFSLFDQLKAFSLCQAHSIPICLMFEFSKGVERCQ